MFDDKFGIKQQFDGVVEGSSADAEMLLVEQLVMKRFHVEVSFNGVDSVKYGISFGSLTMPVYAQIFCKYLFYSLFYIFFLHLMN